MPPMDEQDPLPADPYRLLAAIGKLLRKLTVHPKREDMEKASWYADEIQSCLKARDDHASK